MSEHEPDITGVDEGVDTGTGAQPQDEAALDYMERKGLGDISPDGVKVLRPELIWLYRYRLPDGGTLELIVEWVEACADWDVRVADFHK